MMNFCTILLKILFHLVMVTWFVCHVASQTVPPPTNVHCNRCLPSSRKPYEFKGRRQNNEGGPNSGQGEVRPTIYPYSLQAMAQEFHSFCLVGNHYRNSPLGNWSRFKFLEPLYLPDGHLDIGTHVCPCDYKKMNIYDITDDVYLPSPKAAGTYGPPGDRVYGVRPPRRRSPYWESAGDMRYNRPPIMEGQKSRNCVNPYYIQVDEITAQNPSIGFTERLQNYLHFTVFPKIELVDPDAEKNKCPTGKMKYVFLEVRDQLGFQVGDFSGDIPCHASCKCRTASCTLLSGNRHSAMPCMYTHVRASSQAGIFMAAANLTGPEYWKIKQGNSSSDSVLDEVHATWRFNHHTSYIITQLHFAALVIEDETKLKYWTGRRIDWTYSAVDDSGPYVDDTFATFSQSPDDEPVGHRPYGFTPQYLPLLPTMNTLGAWDYFRKDLYLPKDINCHAGISTDNYIFDPFVEGLLPRRPDDLFVTKLHTWMPVVDDRNDDELVFQNPQGDVETAKEIAKSKDTDQIDTKYEALLYIEEIPGRPPPKERPLNYFGTEYSRFHYMKYEGFVAQREDLTEDLAGRKLMTEIADEERCPCAMLMTTQNPEFATRDKNELQGRKLHAVQMLIAWIVLVPIAVFIIRYYKETYSRVFFMEEFWWYTIHVMCLITALFFMIGGIYCIEIKRGSGSRTFGWTDETYGHVILGALLMIFFFIHLIMGFFRLWDVESRIIQIILHFTCGLTWYIMSIIVILLASAMPYSFMNCWTFAFYIIFLVGLIIWIIAMEIHMRHVDKQLNLHPPRTYLPPPVIRVFHRNAPMAKFRIYVLCFFVLYCLVALVAIYLTMEFEYSEEERFSCFQRRPKPENSTVPDDYVVYSF